MIVGIDLGTTNSLVGVWRDGDAQLISNALGHVLTPSAISLLDSGEIVAGLAARERLLTHPRRSVAAFKRTMGTNRVVTLGDRDFRPEELSALVLRSLKADAEAWLGEDLLRAQFPGGFPGKVPDAALIQADGMVQRVIECGGTYDADRLRQFHRFCMREAFGYELW